MTKSEIRMTPGVFLLGMMTGSSLSWKLLLDFGNSLWQRHVAGEAGFVFRVYLGFSLLCMAVAIRNFFNAFKNFAMTEETLSVFFRKALSSLFTGILLSIGLIGVYQWGFILVNWTWLWILTH